MPETSPAVFAMSGNPQARVFLMGTQAARLPVVSPNSLIKASPPDGVIETLKKSGKADFIALDFSLISAGITKAESMAFSDALNDYGNLLILQTTKDYAKSVNTLRMGHELRRNMALEFMAIETYKDTKVLVFRKVDKSRFSKTINLDKPLRYVIADRIYFTFFGNARFKAFMKRLLLRSRTVRGENTHGK